jgi:hypothetical protein
VRPIVIGLIVFGAFVGLALVLGGNAWLILLGIPLALGAFITFHEERAYGWRDPPTHRPREAPTWAADAPAMDVDEELADLVVSTARHAVRKIEDTGSVKPFVMYQDADGDVRVRQVPEAAPPYWLPRARETARAIGASVPMVVLAVAAWITDERGRRSPAVYLEAAERGYRERTIAFAQRYRPKRGLRPASAVGQVVYLGDAAHTLRFKVELGAAD